MLLNFFTLYKLKFYSKHLFILAQDCERLYLMTFLFSSGLVINMSSLVLYSKMAYFQKCGMLSNEVYKLQEESMMPCSTGSMQSRPSKCRLQKQWEVSSILVTPVFKVTESTSSSTVAFSKFQQGSLLFKFKGKERTAWCKTATIPDTLFPNCQRWEKNVYLWMGTRMWKEEEQK